MNFKKTIQSISIVTLALVAVACGSNNNSTTPVRPGGSGSVTPAWCPPGQGYWCGSGAGGTVFSTGNGMYYGDVYELTPGTIPNNGSFVGTNPSVTVQTGNVLILSGSATWAEFDYDFGWEQLFGWYELDDFCQSVGVAAQVAVSYANQPAHVLNYGSNPVSSPWPSTISFGYANRPAGADCIILNNLTLQRN